MAYRDWDSDFKDIFDQIPGVDYLSSQERAYAEALFEEGFMYSAEQYEEKGLSPEAVEFLREEFWDYMYLPPEEFDWEAWREWYENQLCHVLARLPSTKTGWRHGKGNGNTGLIIRTPTGIGGRKKTENGRSSAGTGKGTGSLSLIHSVILKLLIIACCSVALLDIIFQAGVFGQKTALIYACMWSLCFLTLFTLAFLLSMT